MPKSSNKTIVRSPQGVEEEVSEGQVEEYLRKGYTRQNGTNEVLAHVERPEDIDEQLPPIGDATPEDDQDKPDDAGETNPAAEELNSTRTRKSLKE